MYASEKVYPNGQHSICVCSTLMTLGKHQSCRDQNSFGVQYARIEALGQSRHQALMLLPGGLREVRR